ncbi:MAG: 2-oxoacid:acceptor oxidoreductase family protein [Promethearchaeota archaeon]
MDNKEEYEITVLSRGGQGGILGNKLLGAICYKEGFKDIIAIPIIGAERRGAPIRAYLRISNNKIRRIDAIKNPDYYLILDETLMRYPAIHSLIKDTTVIINSENSTKYTFPESVHIFEIPATRIALDLNLIVAGQPVVNVAMIGAFAKASNLISLKTIEMVILDYFKEKGKLNFDAAKLAFEKTKKVK